MTHKPSETSPDPSQATGSSAGRLTVSDGGQNPQIVYQACGCCTAKWYGLVVTRCPRCGQQALKPQFITPPWRMDDRDDAGDATNRPP
jgi:hypothetical protein